MANQGPLTWGALQNAGIPIDYRAFSAQWDAESNNPPEKQPLHNLVAKFDGTGLTLKDGAPRNEPEVGNDSEPAGEVSKMAKRATKLGK